MSLSPETEIALLKADCAAMHAEINALKKLVSAQNEKMRNAESWGRGVLWGGGGVIGVGFVLLGGIEQIREAIKWLAK